LHHAIVDPIHKRIEEVREGDETFSVLFPNFQRANKGPQQRAMFSDNLLDSTKLAPKLLVIGRGQSNDLLEIRYFLCVSLHLFL
jgi:hypothetical protein